MRLTSLPFIASVIIASVAAKGINCEGSSECPFCHPQTSLKALQQACQAVPDNQQYYNGQHICCTACDAISDEEYSVCAFVQNTKGGAPGHSIKAAIQQIVDHKCGLCGSSPLYNNDVSEGELTVNVVDYTSCDEAICA
ncbi:hypothetical protein PMG11_10390 [Penicillium brasilianum]|uniref:Killer toxin Kp4 domain-containing protein n=1 Tax=Penicillium brasilianum TaxID=104259 RepID=A0A0F7TYR6_PENBI|nr:hypothetical protein PMG11_10390 [Penicillium brasilianum]